MIYIFAEYKDIERIIMKYYELYCNKFSKLNKMDKILEKQTIISLLKILENPNSLIIYEGN